MTKDKWVWMPHAGHFICGSRCQFKLNTYVGGYIVSTVGELPPYDEDKLGEWERIGSDRTYETFVFKAMRSKDKCCPWQMRDPSEIDSDGYKDADSAYKGHLRMCNKWSKKVNS